MHSNLLYYPQISHWYIAGDDTKHKGIREWNERENVGSCLYIDITDLVHAYIKLAVSVMSASVSFSRELFESFHVSFCKVFAWDLYDGLRPTCEWLMLADLQVNTEKYF